MKNKTSVGTLGASHSVLASFSTVACTENSIRSHRLKPKFCKNSFLLLLMTIKSTDCHLCFWPAISKLPGLLQFSSVVQLCLTLCDPMDCSMPGLPVHHQLSVYSNSCLLSWWCHPTISYSVIPSHPAFNLFQHQGFFKWVSSSQQVAKVLEFQFQDQSFQSIFRTDFL